MRLLVNHSQAEITYLSAHQYAGQPVTSLYYHLFDFKNCFFKEFKLEEAIEEAEFFFIALPHGKSMEITPELLKAKCKVVDLTGDFRLHDKELYSQWYKSDHTAPGLLGKAVYGLPELYKDKIKKAQLVANPGCYPTSVILAIAPLLSSKLVLESSIIIHSLSGVSGSGRGAKEETHYCFCNENVSVYKVGGTHQHIPEMEQELSHLAGGEIQISFTPHLAPFSRGIYSTIYLTLREEKTTTELLETYRSFYRGKHFIKILDEGIYPQVKAVRGSNFCHIGLEVDKRTGRVIVFSAIDNLVKGASGQAIQNMNLMCGFSETEGLEALVLYP